MKLRKYFYRLQDKIGKTIGNNNIDKSREDEDDINPHGLDFGFK